MLKRITMTAVALLVLAVQFPAATALAATYNDWAAFVADITVADGTTFAPGTAISKTWRLKNIGNNTWSTSYAVIFVSGDALGANATQTLPRSVAPGGTVDVTVAMTAPAGSGHYRGFWQLRNASGVTFGIGSTANKSFWVDINVSSGGGTSTGYDFAANACSATWRSGAGTLPCPGSDGSANGFVLQVDNPVLEDGSASSGKGLITQPQNINNGYIQGTYPAFTVQSGDHFRSVINCARSATSCWVTFRLDYISGGVTHTFWSFNERYEGFYYNADRDLSSLAGQTVQFVLTVLSAGPAAGDRALWGQPRIVRSGGPTVTPGGPTLTPTNTPSGGTATVTPQVSSSDRALFVTDVTYSDGTVVAPNSAFPKTWRLKNIGSTTWTTSYKLVFASGERMGGSDINLPRSVAPGGTIDLTVNLTSPGNNGTYRGNWMFKNASGQIFGIGPGGNKPFWVEIRVTAGGSSGGTTGGSRYDFATNACSATWSSGAGNLPCPGSDNSANGFVLKLNPAYLEDGTTETPGLMTVPQNVFNGYIEGTYPAFTVQNGDRFQGKVNCDHGATACFVIFSIGYRLEGRDYILWVFAERYEGLYYPFSIPLDNPDLGLVGKSVQFVLSVAANGDSSGDRAVWVAPRITNPNTGATATPTRTATGATTTTTRTATTTLTQTGTRPTSTTTATVTLTPTGTVPGISATPTSTPTPTTTATTTTTSTPPAQTVFVYFAKHDNVISGVPPFASFVLREVHSTDLPRAILTELFKGPTSAEAATGLELISNGATGFSQLTIANGVASIYLTGECTSPNPANFSIADLIRTNLTGFGQIQKVRIFDPNGNTSNPDATQESVPACLLPQ